MNKVAEKTGRVLQIAEAFEGLAAATVLSRGPVPIKAGKGRARILKVIDGSGAVVGYVTIGAVLECAARVADLELATIEGKHPEVILCIDCRAPRKVLPGPLPKHCRSCARALSRKKHADAQRARAAKRMQRRAERSAA